MYMVQIFQTTFYDIPINQKLKVCLVLFVVQKFVSKNEPHMFHFSIILKNKHKLLELQIHWYKFYSKIIDI